MKHGIVCFIWVPTDVDTGKFVIRGAKEEMVSESVLAYPQAERVQARMFNHIDDVRAFKEGTQHPGLTKAIDSFFQLAKGYGWVDWVWMDNLKR